MLEGTNEMRFATMADMFRAARYPVRSGTRTTPASRTSAKIGLKGSPTVVSKVFAPNAAQRVKALVIAGRHAAGITAEALLDQMFTDLPKLEKSLLDHLDALGARQ